METTEVQTSKRYYILDCNDEVVGNPKGYRTFIGAERQQNTTLNDLLWERYKQRKDMESNILNRIVYR
jgi:hypothetical protein